MREYAIGLAALALLAGCTGDPSKDATTFQTYVTAWTPVVDEGLCRAQTLANSAGAIAQAAGDAQGAADASLASQSAGMGCYALKPIAVPAAAVPVAPTS